MKEVALHGTLCPSDSPTYAALQGPEGPVGPEGPQGIQGPVGPEGDTGDKGNTGDTGAQGIQGARGETGPKGDIGETGAEGAMGIQGVAGDDRIKCCQKITKDGEQFLFLKIACDDGEDADILLPCADTDDLLIITCPE